MDGDKFLLQWAHYHCYRYWDLYPTSMLLCKIITNITPCYNGDIYPCTICMLFACPYQVTDPRLSPVVSIGFWREGNQFTHASALHIIIIFSDINLYLSILSE